jgi:hypothetical protein
VKLKAVFMGWKRDDSKHKQIGYKFANVVRPNDILLIARRHENKSELVGCGVVVGTPKRGLKSFKPPHEFVSLRQLSPFKGLSAPPPNLGLLTRTSDSSNSTGWSDLPPNSAHIIIRHPNR